MRLTLVSTLVGLVLAAAGTVAFASPGSDLKWSQLPDMEHGMNYSSESKVPSIVADDWMCNSPLPVSDIHWWGSYWRAPKPVPPGGTPTSSLLPEPDAQWIAGFVLVIYSDIPAGVEGVPYSRPGKALWDKEVPLEQAHQTLAGAVPGKQSVYSYRYDLPVERFFQQTLGTTYWLSVRAISKQPYSEAPYSQWGWHESVDHWNDNAVQDFKDSGWYALNKDGMNTDMAFQVSVVPEPSALAALCGGLLSLAGLRLRRK